MYFKLSEVNQGNKCNVFDDYISFIFFFREWHFTLEMFSYNQATTNLAIYANETYKDKLSEA